MECQKHYKVGPNHTDSGSSKPVSSDRCLLPNTLGINYLVSLTLQGEKSKNKEDRNRGRARTNELLRRHLRRFGRIVRVVVVATFAAATRTASIIGTDVSGSARGRTDALGFACLVVFPGPRHRVVFTGSRHGSGRSMHIAGHRIHGAGQMAVQHPHVRRGHVR